MDRMRAEMDNLFQMVPSTGKFLLPATGTTDRMLPTLQKDFRVDVREHTDEVIVAVDLPGMDKENVSLQLLNPRTLEISCEKTTDTKEQEEDYYIRERTMGAMRRTVSLPADVTEDGAKATFRNGVLEVTLAKSHSPAASRILIE